MSKVDRLNVASAAVLAFLLQPWGLIAACAATLTEADMGETGSVLMIVVYCLLATLTYIAMEVYVVLAPEASRVRLKNLRSWMDGHRDPTIIAVSLILGIWLIGKSVYLLAA